MSLYVARYYISIDGRLVAPGQTLSDREMGDTHARLVRLDAVERLFETGPADDAEEAMSA